MTKFDSFNSDEKALIFLGLAKVNIPKDDPMYQTLQKLLDEFTK